MQNYRSNSDKEVLFQKHIPMALWIFIPDLHFAHILTHSRHLCRYSDSLESLELNFCAHRHQYLTWTKGERATVRSIGTTSLDDTRSLSLHDIRYTLYATHDTLYDRVNTSTKCVYLV